MAKLTLHAIPAFGGINVKVEGGALVEEVGLAIVAVTARTGAEKKFKNAFKKFFGRDCPSTTRSLTVGKSLIVPSALDQFFIIEKNEPRRLEERLIKNFEKVATITDQTDAWGVLSLYGPKTVMTLERVCPVDVDITAFPVGAVARTVLEHVEGIVIRQKAKEEKHRFLLLSGRSSAQSFLHAIMTTLPFAKLPAKEVWDGTDTV